MMTNKNNHVLYIGVTNDLARRVWEHKSHLIKGFTAKYKIEKLVYYEYYTDITLAIQREKQLKTWKREWKNNLINKMNPNWIDMFDSISC
jgi:putative endonuclease